jgi:hypothetical protein
MATRTTKRLRWIAVAAIVAATAQIARAQTNVQFVPTGPADWNTDANWNPAFVPEAQFNENAVIGSNRSAFVDDTPPAVGGITISAGTLEVQSGGSLTAAPNTQVTGALNIGDGAGVGNVIVRRGGSLNVRNISTGGSAASQLTLGETGGAGTATLQVTGGTLNRVTRMVGPNVVLSSSGGLTLASPGTLVPVITGAAHSAISVTGTATLGGTLRPEFSGYTPALGNTWNLVTAGQISGSFGALDLSQVPAMPRGAGYTLTQTATSATLRYTNKLILTVDRLTGETNMHNVIGTPIGIDGYTITSSGANLDGAWNSLDQQNISGWDEADNASASRLTEFNPNGTSTINVGSSLALGNPFSPPAPTALGQAVEDLAFSYAVPGQGTITGIVEYVGRRNNVVLTVDPTTGEAAIQNESGFFSANINAYTITSASGRLQPAPGQWSSLDDQNLSTWDEADNSSAARLTEFNPEGSTLLPGGGAVLDLGTPVNVAGGAPALSDLAFFYHLTNGQTMQGIVSFGTLPTAAGLPGDYNEDAVVDAADYVLWRKQNGSGMSLPNDDTPGVGPDDYTRWRENFAEASGGGGAGIASSVVPEPSTITLLFIFAACGIVRVRIGWRVGEAC